MKLNEKNIDPWLEGHLKKINIPLETELLPEILKKHHRHGQKRRMFFWVNLILIASWLIFYLSFWSHHRNNASILTSKKLQEEAQKINNAKLKSLEAKQNNLGEIPLKPIEEKEQIQKSFFVTKYISPNKKLESDLRKHGAENNMITNTIPLHQLLSKVPLLMTQVEQFSPEITQVYNELNLEKPNPSDSSQNKSLFQTMLNNLSKPQLMTFVSLGYTNNKTEIKKNAANLSSTHKNYQDIVAAGFKNNQGVQMDAGFRFAYTKFSFLGGISYSHSEQFLKFNIPNWEVPVVDINGEIVAYIILNDSLHKTEEKSSKFSQNEISIPLQVSFKQNVFNYFDLELGLGLLPKLRMMPKFNLPGKLELQEMQASKIKANFSAPMVLRFAVYKNFKPFTLGLSGMYTPFNNSAGILPGELQLSSKQYILQITFYKSIHLKN